jgi:hypothetical protein
MGCFRVLRYFPLSRSITAVAKPQELSRNVEIEVIRTTCDISRTETLIYLPVFSDGVAQGHSTAKLDFRELALKQSQVPPNNLAKLEDTLKPSNPKNLESKYERCWGNKDFGIESVITLGPGNARKTVTLTNFRWFLARQKTQPYPVEMEKIACAIWGLGTEVLGEPLERNYVGGCKALGY